MKKYLLHQFALLAALLSVGASALALPLPPDTSPYVTDPQHEYVQDATSEAIGSVNMVLCIMNALNVNDSGMLNVGPYVALVDMNKCDAKGSASDSSAGASGASAAANYMNAVVDASRASNSAPMIAKVWMSMTEQGKKTKVWVKVTATQSPTDVPPYGEFRMDFIGKNLANVTQFNGFIDSAAGTLRFYETGSNSSNVALTMTANSTTSGSGTMTVGAGPTKTYNFNYDPDFFRRSDGTFDQCFDRAKANAKRSVWRLGTYDATTGARVDQAHPGFPVIATVTSPTNLAGTYYGFANYYGINFQGLDLNSIADAAPIIGLVVTDQRPSNSTTYTLSKVSGKLTKWSQHATTLAAMDGIPFTIGGDMTGKTTGNSAVTGWGNWQMKWNAAGNFTVIGTQNCGGSNGCVISDITPVATVNTGAFIGMPLSGWSDSFGGNISIPASASAHAGTDAVNYYTQSLVLPGAVGAPSALYCLSNCPTATSVVAANAYTTGGTPGSPFGGTTATQWFSAPDVTNTVSYTYDSGGRLLDGTTAMIITNAAYFADGPMFQNGVMTGRLFDAALSNANCPTGFPTGAVCEPNNPADYYTWATGTGQWNQSMWLTSGNTIVTLDPPQNIAYTVPSGTEYGSWAGKNIQLQFNGFGNLWGIPGYCVNPVDNSPVDCSTANVRYVPAFSLPDDATMTLGSTTLIIKALDSELRLKDLGAGAAECSGMTLTTATPPPGGVHDMSDSADTAYYIGPKPTVTDPPKVIDGVVQ